MSETMKGTDMTEFLEKGVAIGKEMSALESDPRIMEQNGATYLFCKGKLERVPHVDPPDPECFGTFSLQGLVDFIFADVDGIFSDSGTRHIVRVSGPDKAEIFSPVRGMNAKRACVAKCAASVPPIQLNRFLDAEDFCIELQTKFEPGENRDLVLKLAGNVRDEDSMNTADDGFSQKVTVRRGVASAGDVVVRNPVYLTPLRTFSEVAQPSSPFILRFQEGAQVALFEADGGAWKVKAVETIRDWLRERLEDLHVEVIA